VIFVKWLTFFSSPKGPKTMVDVRGV
jgi:hypothetical protein